MSKLDDMRAMREARYEQAAGRSARPAAAPRPAPRRTPHPVDAPPASQESGSEESGSDGSGSPEACGHRSMNGRTCTREQGHAAKSHRYS